MVQSYAPAPLTYAQRLIMTETNTAALLFWSPPHSEYPCSLFRQANLPARTPATSIDSLSHATPRIRRQSVHSNPCKLSYLRSHVLSSTVISVQGLVATIFCALPHLVASLSASSRRATHCRPCRDTGACILRLLSPRQVGPPGCHCMVVLEVARHRSGDWRLIPAQPLRCSNQADPLVKRAQPIPMTLSRNRSTAPWSNRPSSASRQSPGHRSGPRRN